MTRLYLLKDAVRRANSVVTVGTFDGVHAGHRRILSEMVKLAAGAPTVVVTFDPHPREIIRPGPEPVGLLTTLQERADLLATAGISDMVVVPFTRDFSLIDSATFIKEYLFDRIGMAHYVIGYDHQFGKNREGSIETARAMAKELHFTCTVISKQEIGEVTVSSTQVRNALKVSGDVEMAARFLGRPYQLSGTVVHGARRGRKLGFPTANIQPSHVSKIVPASGVYAVDVEARGTVWRGMLNIGFKPTFESGRSITLEAHLFGFDGDLYGYPVTVRFLKRIREERKFESVEALVAQLERDRIQVQSVPKLDALF
jgi:riboflavin kinase/FMN adenylyltransferase